MAANPEPGSAAETLGPLLRVMFGTMLPLRIELWDGSVLESESFSGSSPGMLRINTPDAIRRVLWSPNELGLARAYVTGELDVEGDMVAVVGAIVDAIPKEARLRAKAAVEAFAAATRSGVLDRPPSPPAQEAQLRGWRHSLRRDQRAISHHYDVGNDFYRTVLGPSMTYSCARFVDDDTSLDDAQTAKHDLVARKLGLDRRPGMRLLDVGCGWGSMAIHAAQRYRASVVGITISREQSDLARKRISEAGVGDLVEIRLQDYRQLGGERFDAISSIGMAEHVGAKCLDDYFEILHDALVPTGRLLNHAISKVGGSRMGRRSFIGRYVFPDGELIDVGTTVLAMERAGFEVRDVESLREHYAKTLKAWVSNLESRWDDAVVAADEGRARVWRLYMAGSALRFAQGAINIHQVLGTVPAADGDSAMPPTRANWL